MENDTAEQKDERNQEKAEKPKEKKAKKPKEKPIPIAQVEPIRVDAVGPSVIKNARAEIDGKELEVRVSGRTKGLPGKVVKFEPLGKDHGKVMNGTVKTGNGGLAKPGKWTLGSRQGEQVLKVVCDGARCAFIAMVPWEDQ